MSFFNYPSTSIVVAHALIVVAISVRVIMRRPATGVALAWLFLVALLPFVGAIIYFLIVLLFSFAFYQALLNVGKGEKIS